MVKQRKITLLLANMVLICLLISVIVNKNQDIAICERHIAAQQAQLNRIPTIVEIQTLLGCKKIDGKLGPGWRLSETQTLWDKEICNQYAMRSFDPNFYEVEK